MGERNFRGWWGVCVFVLLASGMLLVVPNLIFGSLKIRQGCIGTAEE